MTQYTAFQPQLAVINPASTKAPDGTTPVANAGQQNEALVSEIHGKWWTAAQRGNAYRANVTAVTVPVIANGLVSVFSLYNPVGSGIVMELIDFDMAQVLAATIVDAVGLYYDAGSRAAAATFTTKGTIESAKIGSGLVGLGQFYSALTHVNSAGWKRVAIVGNYGATTDAGQQLNHCDFDGKLVVPEGAIISVAMSTTAGTASGLDISMSWAEWPK